MLLLLLRLCVVLLLLLQLGVVLPLLLRLGVVLLLLLQLGVVLLLLLRLGVVLPLLLQTRDLFLLHPLRTQHHQFPTRQLPIPLTPRLPLTKRNLQNRRTPPQLRRLRSLRK